MRLLVSSSFIWYTEGLLRRYNNRERYFMMDIMCIKWDIFDTYGADC